MADNAASYESKEQALVDGGGATKDANLVKMWLSAIDAASIEEKDWRNEADKSVRIYRAEESDTSQSYFNILHSNIETTLPAVYNSTPIPDIRRRFNDPGFETKQVADILERSISYSLDAYDFDATMRSTLFDAYVTGRGVSRVRYVPYLSGMDTDEPGGEQEAPAVEAMEHQEGGEPVEAGERLDYEEVVCEYVPWAYFRRGPGRVWEDVKWIAFEHFMSREQLVALDARKGKLISLDAVVAGHGETQGVDAYQGREAPPESEIFQRARVWEVWDKTDKRVLFIAPGYKDSPLSVQDDPLQLQGFFPIPRPVQPLLTPGNLIPMCPYRAYRRLAEELNDITRRIQRLIKQLRVRGIYAAPTQSVEGILNADDGELVPAPGLEAFIDGGGLEKAIAWWPLDPTVKALAQLYQQREQVKQTIYEVTGLSDILRGNTQASETATAQQIKSQWGSLRIQRMQADVARFARDLFRLKAEIIATRFSTQQLQLMTGIEITPQVEQILRSDLLRAYKIDIESDSTIRADLTRDKQEVSEFIQGTAAYVSAIGPAVAGGIVPKELAVEIYASFARLQRLGKSAEDAIDRAAEAARKEAEQPPQPQPNPEQMKAEAEIQQGQAKLQLEASKAEQDAQLKAADQQRAAAESERQFQLDMMKMEREHEFKLQEMQFKFQLEREKHEMDMQFKAEKQQAELEMMRTNAAMGVEKHSAELENMDRNASMAEEKNQATIEATKAKAKQRPTK